MPRYAIGMRRIRSFDWTDDPPLIPSLDVPEHEATDTGLVDEIGEPIMRLPNPMGFGKDEEW